MKATTHIFVLGGIDFCFKLHHQTDPLPKQFKKVAHQNYHAKVESLKTLIGQKRANTMSEITKRLKVSQRTVLLMIDSVAKSGTSIRYCRDAKIYTMESCKNRIA